MANKIIFDKTVTPQMSSLSVPSSKGSSNYGVGKSGQVLTSNGTNIYWGDVSTNFGTVGSYNTPIYFSNGQPKETGRMAFSNLNTVLSKSSVTIRCPSSSVFLITASSFNTEANSTALFLVTVNSSGYPYVSTIQSLSNLTCKYLETNKIVLTNNTSYAKRIMCLGTHELSFLATAG